MKEEKIIHLTNGWIYFDPDFLSQIEAEKYFKDLKSQLNWQSSSIKLFGKEYLTPRLEAYYAEPNFDYSYSGKKLLRNNFNPTVLKLTSIIENGSNYLFNAVLANWYRNGLDSNGWHADNEKELGRNPLIASLSFGATRRFDLKHNLTGEKISFELNSGSLLIMGGEMQHFWKHQIPKQKKIVGDRINLTFRQIRH